MYSYAVLTIERIVSGDELARHKGLLPRTFNDWPRGLVIG